MNENDDGHTIEALEPSGEMDACPYCGLPVPIPMPGPKAPQAGQLSLCTACGGVSFFEEDMRLREATDEELQEVFEEFGADHMIGAGALATLTRRGKSGAPKNWWTCHSPDCGTKYRGCAPDCPKDHFEQTGEWIGPEAQVVLHLPVRDARELREHLMVHSSTMARDVGALLDEALEKYDEA